MDLVVKADSPHSEGRSFCLTETLCVRGSAGKRESKAR